VNLLNNKNQNLANNLNNHVDNSNQQSNAPNPPNNSSLQLQQQLEQQNTIILQYQQIIRDQDAKLQKQYQINQMISQTCIQWQERCSQLENALTQSQATTISADNPLSTSNQAFQARISELEAKLVDLEEK
jgi:hypothetical protein